MEFVRIHYPRDRRVLLDGEDFQPTNRTFRVDRGTHSFAIDEPADPPEIVEFIELTSQQSPREFSFVPVFEIVVMRGATRSIRAPRAVTPRTSVRKKGAPTPAKAKPRKAKATPKKTKATPNKARTVKKAKPSKKKRTPRS